MPRARLIENFHFSVCLPRGLPEAENEAVRQTLDDVRFHQESLRAVRDCFRQYPSLSNVTVRLSR
jgi:hypothetical protein